MPTFPFTPTELEDLVTFLYEAPPEVAAAPE